MNTSLKRHFEDLSTIEQEIQNLRTSIVSELLETEKHVQGLRKVLDGVDSLLHRQSEEVMHDA